MITTQWQAGVKAAITALLLVTPAGFGPAQAAGEPARPNRTDVDLDAIIRSIETVSFDYESKRIGRNPMTPLVWRTPKAAARSAEEGGVRFSDARGRSVSGIIFSEFNRVAIIDDEVITEGHQYPDRVVVTKIEPKRVWFQWRDSLYPVELKEL